MTRTNAISENHKYILKNQVIEHLKRFPNSAPKEICRVLDINYKKYGATVRTYKCIYKRQYLQFGLRSKPSKTHGSRAVVYAPKSCDRVLALHVGWKQSKNRNALLYWDKNRFFGRIEWWQTGKILVHVKPPQLMSRAKKLLCRAFMDTGLVFDDRVMVEMFDRLDWHSAHDVYDAGQRVPYMKIDTYRKSHGIVVVLGDSSDPSGVEIQWCKPQFAEKIEAIHDETLRVVEINTKQIKEFSKFMKELTTPKALRRDASSMII